MVYLPPMALIVKYGCIVLYLLVNKNSVLPYTVCTSLRMSFTYREKMCDKK